LILLRNFLLSTKKKDLGMGLSMVGTLGLRLLLEDKQRFSLGDLMCCIHMHLFALTCTHIHPKIIISVAFRLILCLVLVYCSTLVLFQVNGAYGAVGTITSTSGAPF
jgi:hypothetical protein